MEKCSSSRFPSLSTKMSGFSCSVMALVTFSVPSEAKRAFNRLSYRKYQHTPLYLEYLPIAIGSQTRSQTPKNTSDPTETVSTAPKHAFTENEKSNNKPSSTSQSAVSTSNPQDSFQSSSASKRDHSEETGSEDSSNTTIYIKNLNWKTTESSVRRLFNSVPGLKSITLPKKKAPSGESLPMGFGFAVYESRAQALRALNQLRGKALDGHVLDLSFSAHSEIVTTKKRKLTERAKEDGEKRTKLLVRNVPFEASRNELRELFGSFGQLKSLRQPKKFDGTSRGFAFVEYVSSDDAKTAIKALASTHLLGRKLVVEYAKEEANVNSHTTFNE